MELAGRTALITGATGGIGDAIARSLAAAGARLVLTGRRAEVLEPLADELGAKAIVCDLGDRDELRRLVAEAGAVDVLVANAALPGTGHVLELSVDQADRILEVNLRAPIFLTRALAPAMVERGSGHIVLISSLNGKAAVPRAALYCGAKFGLRGFALAARDDLRADGVGVSIVYPGFVSEAGMFADSGVKLPPYLRTRSPRQVAAGVLKAIEHNRAEVSVAPVFLRASSAFAGLAPELAAWVTRNFGGEEIAIGLAEGQAEKLK